MVSHVLGVVHYKERLSLQDKSNWAFLYFTCIKIPLLVTACFDNSGFSEMVTLKSPGGVFAVLVFPIRKQITMSIYFPPHTYFIGDLFVLPRVCMLI